VVSGDFYWFIRKGKQIFIAVVDCTGHGVPGAFMSLIGNELIKDIVIANGVTDPAEVLNQLHHQISEALSRGENENNIEDGMDMVFCRYDEEQRELHWSSTGRPVLFILDGELVEKKQGTLPIGVLREVAREYVSEIVTLEKGDSFYLFSDGYTDQFGGKDGERLTTGGFYKLISSIQLKPMANQSEYMVEYFNSWRGSYNQIDDVCIVGVKIT